MRTRPRCAAALALPLPLALALTACGAAADEGESPEAVRTSATATATASEAAPPPGPESAEDHLRLAEKAMAQEAAWSFSVRGQEGLTHQGHRSAATYRATVRRGMEPEVLHGEGSSTSSKGRTKKEEIYVVGGTAYLREGGAAWKAAPASEPAMRNKVEDAVAAVEEFRAYARAGDDAVTVTEVEADGTIELAVRSDGKRKLTAVRDLPWVKKAKREFDPTADQLRAAGIPVSDARLTLSHLEEVLVLDAKTYRVTSHRFTFGFLVPYAGGQDIAYEQEVREDNQGPYSGRIERPEGVR
ncbi:hypothetical protein [Streptomyces vilmorinianum]|uniref:hypothetical protein n=1 Tax=Streptomyces vilmorinianum TaxID=3051092 RepID=UPI0010FB2BB7|nr:hypothetical protein [Streptomyces vilmorinianum]